MPWFIYKYPFPINSPLSYVLIPKNGEPNCHDGEYLAAIKANIMSNTMPVLPDLSDPKLQKKIRKALKSKRGTKSVKLRPTP